MSTARQQKNYRLRKARAEGRVLRLKPGRPKKHANVAARKKAYRIRRQGQVPGRPAGRPRVRDPFSALGL
jgi:hypothetical protein